MSVTDGNFAEVLSKMERAVTLIKPARVLISGDVTDSGGNGFQPYIEIMKEDWDLYKQLLGNLSYPTENIIAVAGNHDVYNLRSFDSPRHFANGILYNQSTFPVAKYVIDDDISVVTVNPYHFPLPPKGLLDWAFPDRTVVDKLKVYLHDRSTHYSIVLGHQPALMWYPNYATTANIAFPELLIRSTVARFYLSGGLDIESPAFYHHGDTLEVVGLRFDRGDSVGVVTFDNYRAGYHVIDTAADGLKAVITSPSPETQISGLDMFDEESGLTLRVLVFSGDSVTLRASGSGITGEQELNCTAFPDKENVQMCELDLDEVTGNGFISVTGDWAGNVSFVVTSTSRGFRQTPYTDAASSLWTFLSCGLGGFVLVMTIPIKFAGVGESFDRWVRGRDANSHWLFAFFGGFLSTHQKLMEAPLYFRIPLFISVLWAFVLPSVFFMLDDAIAVIWNGGYICDGTSVFHFFGMQFHAFFYYSVVFPLIIFASAVEVTRAHSFAFVIDCIVYVASFAGWFATVYLLSTVFSIWSTLTSPIFVLFPIYLHGSLIFWTIKTVRHDRRNRHMEVPFISVSLIDEE